jgi:hypothetical protein
MLEAEVGELAMSLGSSLTTLK